MLFCNAQIVTPYFSFVNMQFICKYLIDKKSAVKISLLRPFNLFINLYCVAFIFFSYFSIPQNHSIKCKYIVIFIYALGLNPSRSLELYKK